MNLMRRLFLEKGWVLLLVGKKPTFIKGEVEGGMWKVEVVESNLT